VILMLDIEDPICYKLYLIARGRSSKVPTILHEREVNGHETLQIMQ
jgi:hypothetical protein